MTWQGAGLEPWQVIPAALSAGALAPADVVRSGVLVDPVGRSHTVYRVTVGTEPRFFLKLFGPSRGATDGSAGRERAVLALAAEQAAVAALVPRAWPWHTPSTGTYELVATAAVPGAEAWKLETAGGGTRTVDEAWRELVAALAAPLTAFHRATRHLARPGATVLPALQPVEPWPLRLMDGDAPPELWATPALATLLREAAADTGLVAGLRAARAAWKPLAVIHADLKHDNVMLAADGAVRVLDWEMARLGDPAWDLATLTARLTIARGDGPPWVPEDVAAAALLLRHYASASGLTVPALAQRLIRYVGAVLLMTALQHASTLAPGADLAPARQLVLRSRATFARENELTNLVSAKTESLPG